MVNTNWALSTIPAVMAMIVAGGSGNVPLTVGAGVAAGIGSLGVLAIKGQSVQGRINQYVVLLSEKEEQIKRQKAPEFSKGNLTDLQQQFKDLRTEKEKVQKEINDLQVYIGEKSGELASIRSAYKENKKYLDQLYLEKQEIENAVARLRESNPNLEDRVRLTQEFEKLSLETGQLKGLKEALSIEVTKLKEEEKQFNQVTGELTVKAEQLAFLNQQLKILAEKNKELELQETKLKIDIKELESVKVSYDKSQTERDNLQSVINQLTPQVQSLQLQRDEILNTIRQHEGDYQKVLSQKDELTELKDELLKKNNDINNLQVNIGQKSGELAVVEATYKENKISLDNLIEQKQEIENTIAALRQSNPNLEDKVRLSLEIEKNLVEASQLEGRKEALSIEVNRLKEEERQFIQAIGALSIKSEELASINQQIEILARRKEELELQENKLKDNINEFEQRENNLKNNIKELESVRVSYDRLQAERDNLQSNINQLTPQVQAIQLQKEEILNTIKAHQVDYQIVLKEKQELAGLKDDLRKRKHDLNILIQREINLDQLIIELEGKEQILKVNLNKLEDKLSSLKDEIQQYQETANKALEPLLKPALWTRLPGVKRAPQDENIFLKGFQESLAGQGFLFPTRIIKAFHTSLKVQDISALAILAGISGTGKSELPRRYAAYIGAQMLDLAVQPRWDSPQDLLGFYNYIEKKYKPTELMRGIYQYQKLEGLEDRIVLVLLDEMNLARIEYYFSEFLSKLEIRRSKDAYLELEVGSLSLAENERRVKIPKEFLFVGTMNEDETTQSLSDKVLDRSNVMTFGKPTNLKLREQRGNIPAIVNQNEYISYSNFQSWAKSPDTDSHTVQEITDKINKANSIMKDIGHEFGHRVYQAIVSYVVNYPEVDNDEKTRNQALADQFAQKLLPKLRGVLIDEKRKELDQLSELIKRIGDEPLTKAFEVAKEGSFGQFQWRGMIYPDDQENNV
jgi:chromosome segregation ATPase